MKPTIQQQHARRQQVRPNGGNFQGNLLRKTAELLNGGTLNYGMPSL